MKKEKFSKEEMNSIMYFHGQTTDGTRFTIAGMIDTNHLIMGASVCCERDMFRKSAGRSIARTRLLSLKNPFCYGKSWHVVIDLTENEFKYFARIASEYNESKRVKLLKDFNLYNEPPQPF